MLMNAYTLHRVGLIIIIVLSVVFGYLVYDAGRDFCLSGWELNKRVMGFMLAIATCWFGWAVTHPRFR